MLTLSVSDAIHNDPAVLHKFGDGFGECVGEVNRYLSSIDGFSPDAHRRLMEHLSGCAQKVYTSLTSPRLEDIPSLQHSPTTKQQHSPRGVAPSATGLPPLPLNHLQQQTGLGQMFHPHNLPVGLIPPTPMATPPRTLPGHNNNAHLSPTSSLSPISPIHEHIMQPNDQARQTESLQRSPTEHRQRFEQFHVGAAPKNNVPSALVLTHSSRRYVPGYEQMVVVKQEPVKHMAVKSQVKDMRNEHARFLGPVQVVGDDVWRPW